MRTLFKKKPLPQTPPLTVVQKVLCERSLFQFTKNAWSIVEPKKFIYGWHIEAVCEHVQAVMNRDIRNLLINLPPRHTKSLSGSVFLTPWAWTYDPSLQFIYASYAHVLSLRDSARARRVIQSPWYQQSWGNKFNLMGDQNEKIKYETDANGYRIATSVDGVGTGEGGDFIIADDPHNVKEGESDKKRYNALVWWDETIGSRLNEPDRGGKIIIMQRCHEKDLAGHVLKEKGYEHLCLPAEYEGFNRCKTSLYFKDPRTRKGEPLHPQRVGKKALAELKIALGPYAYAGQYQQNPAPRKGGEIEVDKLRFTKGIEKDQILQSVRYWDKAGTQDGGKRTAGCLMHSMKDGSFIIEHIAKGQWSAPVREARIKMQAQMDGRKVKIWIEQEPGSGGKESAENTIKNLAGYVCRADKVTGDKQTRAEPFAGQVAGGNIYLLIGEWNQDFVDEGQVFPNGEFSDQIDSASGAFNKLTGTKKKAGVW